MTAGVDEATAQKLERLGQTDPIIAQALHHIRAGVPPIQAWTYAAEQMAERHARVSRNLERLVSLYGVPLR
jgi:hypothetical protein